MFSDCCYYKQCFNEHPCVCLLCDIEDAHWEAESLGHQGCAYLGCWLGCLVDLQSGFPIHTPTSRAQVLSFFTFSSTLLLSDFWMGVYLTPTLYIVSSVIILFLHMRKLRLKSGKLRERMSEWVNEWMNMGIRYLFVIYYFFNQNISSTNLSTLPLALRTGSGNR